MSSEERQARDTVALPASHLSFLLAACLLSSVLALQGWRSSAPYDDTIPYMDGVRALLSRGEIPAHGNGTHFYSLTPPGFTWVMVPGAWLFDDPRLWDAPGNLLLHFLTLTGVFLLARAFLPLKAAVLAVVFYAVSWPGLEFAQVGYETRGLPVFYVWTAYWTCRWVDRRDGRFLLAALVTWMAGMYVHMEMAPAFFMLPAAWLMYRPPVSARTLTLAAMIGVIMWWPYLRFEASRGFADVISQVRMQTLPPIVPAAQAGCEVLITGGASTQQPADAVGPLAAATRRLLEVAHGIVINFTGLVGGSEWLLTAMALAGMAMLAGHRRAAADIDRPAPVLILIGSGLLVASALTNQTVLSRLFGAFLDDSRLLVRPLQWLLALAGLVVLNRRRVQAFLTGLREQIPAAPNRALLVLVLTVPWTILLLLTENGRQYRLVGLWPLQVVVLASFVGAAFARWRVGRMLLPALVTMVLFANPFTASHLEGWRRDGWAGADASEVLVADYLAAELRASGRATAVIGYRPLLADGDRLLWNPSGRQGASFAQSIDLLLEVRAGIENENTCWQRLAVTDEYRVVQTAAVNHGAGNASREASFHLVTEIGPYQVYKADRRREM